MQRLSLTDFSALEPVHRELMGRTAGIDQWCSAQHWGVPALECFGADAEPLLLIGDSGLAQLAIYRPDPASDTTIISGLDAMWGFSSSLLGSDLGSLAYDLARTLRASSTEWQIIIFQGLPASRPALHAVAEAFAPLGTVGFRDGISRRIIDLRAGIDPWWERQSSRFRRNMRRAQRQAETVPITYEIADLPEASRTVSGGVGHEGERYDATDALMDRILAIEAQSWKGRQGQGLLNSEMAEFYRRMTRGHRRRHELRCVFAQADGTDIGYILGASNGLYYRGFQASFHADWSAYSVGMLLQYHEICRATRSGVTHYDLGMDMAYKARFTPAQLRTMELIVLSPEFDAAHR